MSGIISLLLTFLLTGGIRAVSLVGLTQLAVAYKEENSNHTLDRISKMCCCGFMTVQLSYSCHNLWFSASFIYRSAYFGSLQGHNGSLQSRNEY